MKQYFLKLSLLLLYTCLALAQQTSRRMPALPPGPMLDGGHMTIQTSALSVDLLRYSGTVAKLTPAADTTLDYTPGDRLAQRSADTFYHLGDLDLRIKTENSGWRDLSTAFERHAINIVSSDATHFEADLTPTLPADSPVKVVRTWFADKDDLVLRFSISNISQGPIEVGGIGIPMIFNNIMTGRTLDQAYSTCSFDDPYIGEDAGYVQVARLTGNGPVLLVLPYGHTPFEAWKPILDHRDHATGKGLSDNDPTPRSATFEGSYDWMVRSAGFAQTDWKGAEEWNPPTEQSLSPGKSISFGLRFVVAPSLRKIEATLAERHRPVAVGIPGYVLPQDIEARLFLRYDFSIRSIVSEPAGAIEIHDDGKIHSGLHVYTLRGKQWGRSRLVITYADGTIQAIAYRTIKPETQAVADMGRFLFHEQWFTSASDPFHRAPSIISYDNSTGKQIVQEPRVWIAGLSDEAGAGSWLAAAMKEYEQPNSLEVAQLESFIDGVLWGRLQESSGEHKYGVHKSLFFYQPDLVPGFPYNSSYNWKTWTSWDKKGADDVGRSYNYPHVVAAYWSLYRIARNTTGLTTKHSWDWYLNQAFETTLAMSSQAPYYTQFGQMEGTIFIRLLNDMRAECWTEKANQLESVMQSRADHWKTEAYPFGSEMPWDSTGQEEVYGWSRFFGYNDKAKVTLNAILAYTPVLPSWGYNGSARRYWDFLYGGKYPRIERQLHHYGSGLNAIPLLDEYRAHPDDLYLLRAGYGGVMGPLTNIDQKGFASAAFHSFPDRMAFDPYSGDYGPNFFGHAMNTATYLTHDQAMGWLCFGGNVTENHGRVHVAVLDSLRQRVFLAPLSLWITLDAGRISSVDIDQKRNVVTLHLATATPNDQLARLRLSVTTPNAHRWAITEKVGTDAGAYVISLGAAETTISLKQQP